MTRRFRAHEWIIALACVVAVVEIGRVGILFRYRTDEYTYAHAAWAIAHGQEPYRDYFLHHFPLSMQLGSLVFRLSDEPQSIQWLRWLMVPVWGVTLACAVWINRRHGTVAALATVPILATLRTWVDFGTEFRPDTLAFALFLFAFAALTDRGTRAGALAFVAGLAWTAAVWASQKVLIYGSFLWLVALADLRARRFFVSPGRFVIGTLVAAVPVAVYLTATSNWLPWIQWCYHWGLAHERFDGRRPLWMSIEETVVYSWPVLLLACVGVADAVRSRRDATTATVLLLVALATTVLSFALQKAPYGYSLIPGLALVAIFAARAVESIGLALVRPSLRVTWLVAFVCLAIAGATWPEQALAKSAKRNSSQRAMLERIGRLTAPDDPVYDNVGIAVARPHVHFFFFTDETLRKLMPDVLEREIPKAIASRGAVVAVHDSRWRGLPRGLRDYLETHFVDVGDDIMLWGRAFEGSGVFHANRDAHYYVVPADAARSISIDGVPLVSDVFELQRGEHAVLSAAQRFAILWLPRDASKPAPRSLELGAPDE